MPRKTPTRKTETRTKKTTSRSVRSTVKKGSSPISNILKSKKDGTKLPIPRAVINIAIFIVAFFISLVIVDYGVQYLNNDASVAIVDGQRISRSEYLDQLEQSYGTVVASNLIDETLIRNEASKQKVTISSDDIDKEISNLEDSYGGKDTFNAELKARNISRDELKDQIETSLLVEEMVGKDIEITEEEKKAFYDEYKDVIIPDNSEPTYEEAESTITDNLRDQKLSEMVTPWLEELRTKATIQNNIEDPKDYSFLGTTRKLIDSIMNGDDKDK